MQKEVFYGLSVYPSIGTTEKQYLDVKACIEKAGARITQLSSDTQVKEKLKESQPIIFWFALSTPFYLTAKLSADDLQFAVYNCKTKEIMQTQTYDVFASLNKANFRVFEVRCENFINQFMKGTPVKVPSEINSAWNMLLEQQKAKTKNNQVER